MAGRSLQALVEVQLHHLRGHPALEDCTPERVSLQLLRGADAQQVADQARIVEVQLGGLHQALALVAVPGPQAEAEKAALQQNYA